MVDYVLTVAVSISSAAANIGSVIPFVASHKVLFAVGAIVVLTAINLRGVHESATLFAIPTYAFVVGILGMLGWGVFQEVVLGEQLRAESADFELAAEEPQLAGVAFAFLALRAFSSGCAALTGVEAISNGVPAFRKPKARNAATTLALMGVFAVIMFLGLLFLARTAGVVIAEHPEISEPEELQTAQNIGSGHPATGRRTPPTKRLLIERALILMDMQGVFEAEVDVPAAARIFVR